MIVPTDMRAAVLHPDLTITIEQRPVPNPGPGEVLIRVGSVGVCGSDVHYFRHGRIGSFVVDSDLVLGHEVGGTIVGVGDGVDADRIGQRVGIEPQRPCRRCEFCRAGTYNLCTDMKFYGTPPIDGALCDYVTIDSDFAHPVPDELTDADIALLEPLSVGIAAIQKAAVGPGSRVLIAGAGPIGLIIAEVARAFGAAEIIVSDPVAERRELAGRHGATCTVDPTATDAGDSDNIRPQRWVDAFIDASGAEPAIQAGVEQVRPAGHVVLVGMGADRVAFPLPAVQNRELIVTGLFRYTNTWPLGIQLLANRRIELGDLITSSFPLEESEQALASAGAPGEIKVLITVSTAAANEASTSAIGSN